MRVVGIEVEGLFGLFNHRIELNRSERITIVYGPNGLGKTTLLRLVADLFQTRFVELRRTRFDALTVTLDDGTQVVAYHGPWQPTDETEEEEDESDDDVEPRVTLWIDLRIPDSDPVSFPIETVAPRSPLGFPLNVIERELPSLARTGPRLWTDRFTGEELTLVEVADRYEEELPILRDIARNSIPEQLAGFLRQVEVHFIETQRLLTMHRRGRTGGIAPTVPEYSTHLVDIIQEYLTRSARLSQQLDRTFPGRLLTNPAPSESDSAEHVLRERFRQQTEFRERLMRTALLDMGEDVALPERQLEPHERVVLWTYLNDAKEKLEVFEPLLDKLELLLEIINSRFLYKEMRIDAESGFAFRSGDGSDVHLQTLSSGEQHELVLAYQLLFRVREGSLVLIDEPEISLHVTWQQRFLEDILRVSRLAHLDFLIATHSPQIIHDRLDLAVALVGPPE